MEEITRFTLETRIEECNRILDDLDTALKITETEDLAAECDFDRDINMDADF